MVEATRVIEHVHGHLGWLAAAALLHPAILLRDRRRRAHLAVALATGFVTVAGAMGVGLYGAYRDRIKQAIFLHAPQIGFLFERKEHLAFGAVVLAWAGALAYAAAARTRQDPIYASLRTFAFRAFAIACALATLTAILGTIVASYRTF